MANGFTPKQRAFIEAYLGRANGNATEAARLAGYSDAAVSGSENKRNQAIWAEISKTLNERSLAAGEVVSRLSEQARGEHTAFVRTKRPDGEPCAPYVDVEALIAAGKAHLIKGIKMTRHGPQVEFYDAQAALQLIGRHHGLFTDKLEIPNGVSVSHSGNIDVNSLTPDEAQRRYREALSGVPGGAPAASGAREPGTVSPQPGSGGVPE